MKDPLQKIYLPVSDESAPGLQFRHNQTTLFIPRVDQLSPEQFMCEGSNSEGRSQPVRFLLLIYEKPGLVIAPRSLNASTGDTVTFGYHVTGRPKPEVQWTIKGNPLVAGPLVFVNDSHLIFFNVTKQWSSSLQLKVTNSYGDSLANVIVNVLDRTRILSMEKGVSYSASSSSAFPDRVSFHCDAETDPSTPLEIRWFVDSSQVSLSSTFFSPSSSEKEAAEDQRDVEIIDQGTLWLNLTDHLNDGKRRSNVTLTCLASNGYSSANRTIVLLLSADHGGYVVAMMQPANDNFHASDADSRYLISYLGYFTCAVVLLVIVVIVTFHLKKRYSVHQQNPLSPETAAAATSTATFGITRRQRSTSSAGHRQHHQLLHQQRDAESQCRVVFPGSGIGKSTMKDLHIPRDRLHVTETIAQGRFGRVFAAFLQDSLGELRETVAVKALNMELLETDTIDLFLREAEISRNFQHANVLGVLGVAYERSGGPLIVQPFMANGDLTGYISNPHMDFTVLVLLQFGLQVVTGMVYLTNLPVVHCHLRTAACLVNDRGVVKVAGFDLTRELIMRSRHREPENDMTQVMRWMAVETIEANMMTTMSDVWSYGVLLWELMTRGTLPYHEVKDADILNFLQTGRRLCKPRYCPDDVYTLMSTCWSHDPLQRPKFQYIEDAISRIIQSAERGGSQNTPGDYVNLITPRQVFDE